VGLRVRRAEGEDLRGIRGVEAADNVLPVLPSPSPVAAETSGGRAAPVQTIRLVLPGGVVGFIVAYFADPVPGAGVQDVLEAGEFGLREDGGKLVGYAEGVWALEEAVCGGEGRRVADIGEGGRVVDVAEWAGGVCCDVVGGVVFECLRLRV
jgi:hypothetical protein